MTEATKGRRKVGFSARAWGLILGYAADLAFADPRRGHPVAGFGRVASALEGACWADDRARGAAYTEVLVGSMTGAGWVAQRATRGRRLSEAAVVAVATWAVLGGRGLAKEGAGVRWRADPNAPGFAARGESMLDRLADAIEEHLDTAALAGLVGIDF